MTTDDTPTITEQLIEAVRTTPGAGSGWIAKAIGSDDIHTCAALLFKLAKRGVLRREGEPRAYRYYIGDVDPSQQPESTPKAPAAQGADAASTGPTWSRPVLETCDDDDDIDDEDDDDDSIDDKTRETGESLSDALTARTRCSWAARSRPTRRRPRAFGRIGLGGDGVSELREAAQAVVTEFDDWGNTEEDMEQAIARLRAALAQPETAEPPRDEWRLASDPPDSDRDVQAWIKIDLSELDGVVTEQCDAQAFYEDGVWYVRGPDHDGWMQLCPGHMVSVVAWRDVTPLTEGAK